MSQLEDWQKLLVALVVGVLLTMPQTRRALSELARLIASKMAALFSFLVQLMSEILRLIEPFVGTATALIGYLGYNVARSVEDLKQLGRLDTISPE